MLDHPKFRASVRNHAIGVGAVNLALWDTVDAILDECERTRTGRLANGELERLREIVVEEGGHYSMSRITHFDRIGQWLIDSDGSDSDKAVVRNFPVSLSLVAIRAGLSVRQAAEKLRSQEKWSIRSFEAAICPSVPEPESKRTSSLVPDSVEEWIKSLNPPEPETKTTRIVVKPAQTEEEEAEEIRTGLRATQPQMSEERIEELINMFVRGIRPPKSEYDKFIESLDRARKDGEKLYQVMRNAERALTKEYSDEERATFLGGFLFWNDREKVLSSDLWINLMGGPSDEEIAQALEKFENGS